MPSIAFRCLLKKERNIFVEGGEGNYTSHEIVKAQVYEHNSRLESDTKVGNNNGYEKF